MKKLLALICSAFLAAAAGAADHNDPNSVNSIFSDIPESAADLYDMFGWPSDDKTGGEKVILALTFAPVPQTGVFDPDMLYRIRIHPDPRVAHDDSMSAIDDFLQYAEAVDRKYVQSGAFEVRMTTTPDRRAKLDFIGFPDGDFSHTVETNTVLSVAAPGNQQIKVFVGGRDDAFFNDLPGFFRSINYGPQYYHVPLSAPMDMREWKIPKTLLELEGNTLFNEDPRAPGWGRPEGFKKDVPAGPKTWSGSRFAKDANGKYRFVYSGRDAQAGRNINAIILEIPLASLTKNPTRDRIVNVWGESWVLKAASKIETIPDDPHRSVFSRFGSWLARPFRHENDHTRELRQYKLVDTDGIPFADAGLSEREDNRQLGANNIKLARHFAIRFGHLGWGFGPSVSALGLPTCFDHDDSPVSVYRTYSLATQAFPRVKRCFFQPVNMPDDSWNPKRLNIPLKRPFEIFIPNTQAIDMDTTGTWPYGRRLEDQVATRFLSIFLDHRAKCGAQLCHLETLGQQSTWDGAPIEPKTPPNPLKNDKPFLSEFPYLAEPW